MPARVLLRAADGALKRVADVPQVLREQEASVLHVLCGVNSDRYQPVMERACMRTCERCGHAYTL